MTDEISYSVMRSLGGVELRRYPSFVLATVPGMPENSAFGILFDYITGTNRSRKRISMTAPVISSEKSSERIPMTTPVVSDESSFSFVLPLEYSISTAPEPLDDRVRLEEIRERSVAVLRFRGRTGAKQVAKKTELLLDAVLENNLRVKGKPFLMRYNPPFVPGFLRRNEIAVEIRE